MVLEFALPAAASRETTRTGSTFPSLSVIDRNHRTAPEQEAAPAIRELQSRVDAIRTAEVEKCLRKLGPITDHQRATIEQATLQMINKILHHPIVQLREDDSMRPTIRKVFGLA